MKKSIILTVFIFWAFSSFAYKFTGLSWDASRPGMETGGRNFLPWNAGELENKYGFIVHVFRFNAGSKIEPERLAKAYYNTITRTAEDKVILIWVNNKQNEGVILASPPLKKIIPEETLKILQEDALRPLINKWYISEQRVFSKILGTLIYVMEKQNGISGQIDTQQGRYIKIDDPLYKISLTQPFFDLVKLFYFEPITFCLYFPLVMYAFFVRLIGVNFGRTGYLISNLVWLLFTGFVFFLILYRVNVLFPEYVSMLSFFIGLNAPFYIILFILYKDRVEAAAYAYLHSVTGGFSSNSLFGDSK